MENGKKVVLVIDDEESIREYVRHVLEAAGYIVIEAEDGRKGQELFRNVQIDLLITDLVMPGREGIETIVAIKSEFPDLRMIAMSGVVNSDTYLNIAGCLGAHATLQKPFSRTELLDTIGKVVPVASQY